jgi:hypothetical protein
MAEMESASTGTPEVASPARSANEVALEMMKFIAVTTGYGKVSQSSSAGFSGKPLGHSAEEHAEKLLELFDRCREVVKKDA